MSSYTEQAPALRRVQYDPAADGTVVAQAFFETVLVNDDDPTDKITKPWAPVSFPLTPELSASVLALAQAALSAQ